MKLNLRSLHLWAQAHLVARRWRPSPPKFRERSPEPRRHRRGRRQDWVHSGYVKEFLQQRLGADRIRPAHAGVLQHKQGYLPSHLRPCRGAAPDGLLVQRRSPKRGQSNRRL